MKNAKSGTKATPASAGYSGTPLPVKLGLKSGQRVLTVNPPPHLPDLLSGAPTGLHWLERAAAFDFALVFATDRATLASGFKRLAPKMSDAGMIWIAWPKKSSGVATELTEDGVRDIGLAAGLVDVKVCAIDATWSGLKFVRRLADRAAKAAPRR